MDNGLDAFRALAGNEVYNALPQEEEEEDKEGKDGDDAAAVKTKTGKTKRVAVR